MADFNAWLQQLVDGGFITALDKTNVQALFAGFGPLAVVTTKELQEVLSDNGYQLKLAAAANLVGGVKDAERAAAQAAAAPAAGETDVCLSLKAKGKSASLEAKFLVPLDIEAVYGAIREKNNLIFDVDIILRLSADGTPLTSNEVTNLAKASAAKKENLVLHWESASRKCSGMTFLQGCAILCVPEMKAPSALPQIPMVTTSFKPEMPKLPKQVLVRT